MNKEDLRALNEAYNKINAREAYTPLTPRRLPAAIDAHIQYTLYGGDNEDFIFSVGVYKGKGFIQTDEGPEGFPLHPALLDGDGDEVEVDLSEIYDFAQVTGIGYVDDQGDLVAEDPATPEFADAMQDFLDAVVRDPSYQWDMPRWS